MSKEQFTLTYLNEDDRAYGLAGMAISLAAHNAIDRVASISLDSNGPMINFTHAYYFTGSPSMSPKASWDILINNFYLTTAMVISNVMARSMVRLRQEIPEETLKELYTEIEAEGAESCSLDSDEVNRLYLKTLAHTRRIFSNPRLHNAIDEFAHLLARKRTLSGTELLDELETLQIV